MQQLRILMEILKELVVSRFYGDVKITFRDGKINHVHKMETIKIPD